MHYGLWTVFELLYEREGTRIYNTDQDNILKIMPSDQFCDELHTVLACRMDLLRNAISCPKDPAILFGTTEEGEGWYVMKGYKDYVHCGTEDWAAVGIACLNFLEDLHHKLHRVHADIKRQNVLFEDTEEGRRYVVADYELVRPPSTTALSCYDPDVLFYYLGRGGDLDKPYKSWRYDLTSVAYMLIELTWDTEGISFMEAFSARRKGDSKLSTAELLRLRDTQIAEADPIILAFLDHLKTVDWLAPLPPLHSFYEELRQILRRSKPGGVGLSV